MSNLNPASTHSSDGCVPESASALEMPLARSDTSRQWTLKGLAPETVEVSRDAAKRSGMKLNAWVSRALANAAVGADFTGQASAALNSNISNDKIEVIMDELLRLRAESEDMKNTVNSMSSILLKLFGDKIQP
jgi:hypothetical protein